MASLAMVTRRTMTLDDALRLISECPERIAQLPSELRRELEDLLSDAERDYSNDPLGYMRDVLGLTLWSAQEEIVQALMAHKRVLVKASHAVGKTYVAAALVNWHFDTFNPGLTLTTAPTAPQVNEVLWKEVRKQRKQLPLRPSARRAILGEAGSDHYAQGYTSETGEAFQGRHEEHILFVFDEAVGVPNTFWESAEGMMTTPQAKWLAICNPTDMSSAAYEAEVNGLWHVISVSALDHPNITAQLKGKKPPIPAAVGLQWVEQRVKEWCTRIGADGARVGDVEWPPGKGRWYRPGPLFESRVIGRWPSQGSLNVWTESVWSRTMVQQGLRPLDPLEIGCDVARYGDDFTTIIARRGYCAIHYETHNGWSTKAIAERLQELARQLCEPGEEPRKAVIRIDDDGVGGGVVDNAFDYNFVGVSGASRALQAGSYPNKRSELWFAVAEAAADNRVELTRLPEEVKLTLRRQAMAPQWKLDSHSRRVVEPKSDTKKRLGRSPDDMDALNLAFAGYGPEVSYASSLYD